MASISFREVATAVVLMITAASAAQVQAQSKEQVLRDVIHQDKRILLTVEKRLKGKALPHIGTAMNELGLQEAECAGLAVLLGKKESLNSSDVNDFPPQPWDTEAKLEIVAMAFRLASNGIVGLESALAASPRDRALTWNLSCLGRFQIAKNDFVPQAAPQATLEFYHDQIQVFGEIYPGFFEEFKNALDARKDVKTVVLGSGGGSVRDAILAGRLIRDRQLKTTLRADCYSACPLVFLGGVERLIWSPYPRLGFHQVSAEGKALPTDHAVYKHIAEFARAMGVDSNFIVARMQQSPPSDMNHPVVWELCEPRVTTWVQRGC